MYDSSTHVALGSNNDSPGQRAGQGTGHIPGGVFLALEDRMTTSIEGATLVAAAEAAMRANGFEPDFSAEVMREVGSLRDPAEVALPPGTIDLRALPWSSIDNRTSKDLDQIEVADQLPDGSIRVRI